MALLSKIGLTTTDISGSAMMPGENEEKTSWGMLQTCYTLFRNYKQAGYSFEVSTESGI